LEVLCPTLEEQETFLQRAGLPAEFIPYNLDNRRNVGYLMAWERGSDFLISIDDDNFCTEGEDYFAALAGALFGREPHAIEGDETRFLNICDLLETNVSPVYARGYPYFARHRKSTLQSSTGVADIKINAGLWLQDPDVDAITWLGLSPKVTGFQHRSIVLDAKTWSPINTQNTAVRRDLLPAYYFIRMGYPLGGGKVAYTRKHKAPGGFDERKVSVRYHSLCAQMVKRLEHRGQVAGFVVDHRYAHHNNPLVEGSIFPSCLSLEQATRRARAKALKMASIL